MKLLFSTRKRLLFALAFFQVVGIVAVIYSARLTGQFVDHAISDGFNSSYYYLLIMVPLLVFFYLSRSLTSYLFNHVLFNVRLKLLIKKLQTNKSFETVHNEINVYVNQYIYALFGIAWVVVNLVATVVIMALISWILAIVLIVIFLFCYFIPKIYALSFERLTKKKLEIKTNLASMLNSFELNAPTISLNGVEMANLIDKESKALALAQTKIARLSAYRNSFTSIIIGLISLSIVIASALLIYFNQASIGNLLAASLLAISLTQQIPGLTSDLADFKNSRWITKIKDTLDGEYTNQESLPTFVKTLTASIITKQISEKRAIKFPKLSFNAPTSVLITGANGVGKTTLVKVIAGLDLEYHGTVLINHARQAYAPNNGVIYQSSSTNLIPGTVTKNITRFDNKANLPHLNEIALALNISDLLARDIIGLSAGEVALVKVATMLYSNASVRIYDEVFANLAQANRDQVINYALSYSGINIIIAHHQIDFKFSQVIKLSN